MYVCSSWISYSDLIIKRQSEKVKGAMFDIVCLIFNMFDVEFMRQILGEILAQKHAFLA